MKFLFPLGLLMLSVLPLYAQKNTEPIVLPVAEVAETEDFQSRTYPGRVVAVAQVNLIARVNGEILEQGFQNGDIVKAGQMLYRLDSVKYHAAVKNAEAKIAEYKARAAYAESNYSRNKQLSESKAVSQDTLENALSARNAYLASLAAAEADLESAKDDLNHCRILAPITGKIGTSNFTVGNYVTSSSGTLASVIQTSPIRVRFAISSRDFLLMFGGRAHNIIRNGAVTLTLANGKEFAESGAIEYMENAADDNTDTILVFARFPNTERILKPGGTVGVTLSNKTGIKYPAVVPSSIMQNVKGSYVWIVDKTNRVSRRYIVRGGLTKNLQLIESGLRVGDRIVTDGTHKVREGEIIHPVSANRN